MVKKLVLFDVDHTLMDVGDCHKRAFAKGFNEVLGIDLDYSIWKFHGYTDLQIIHEIMDAYNIKKEPQKIARIMKVMISEFEKEDLSCACLMPGVPKILEKVKDTDAIIGLVTGNLEEIAYTKLRHFKIHEFFILGGFGHISPIRSDLVEYAIKKAEEKFGKIKKSNVFIIGDTPHDIKAAKDAGVKVIATATGSYSYKEIKEKNPDYIFKNLEDTEKVIEVIQHG